MDRRRDEDEAEGVASILLPDSALGSPDFAVSNLGPPVSKGRRFGMNVPGLTLAALDATALREQSERDAFALAVRLLEPGLVTLIWRLLGWPAQAAEIEDVLQDVLLAAWTHRERLREPQAFAGWLRRIAVTRSRNHARSTRRRTQRMSLAGFGPGEEPAITVQDPVDDAVRDALAMLRHADREVLVLHYLEGSSIEAIAELFGAKRNAVEARLSRARKRLRARLTENRDG